MDERREKGHEEYMRGKISHTIVFQIYLVKAGVEN
jgi:hypothetical protein